MKPSFKKQQNCSANSKELFYYHPSPSRVVVRDRPERVCGGLGFNRFTYVPFFINRQRQIENLKSADLPD
jgi:hypothetical protein